MTHPAHRIVELAPDDDLFPSWCEVWAAAGRDARPDDPPRPAQEHLALGRELLAPGGSRDGTHRAVLVDGAVAGALRLVLPLKDNPSLAVVDLAVHPAARRRGLGSALLAEARALAAALGRTLLVGEVDEPGPGAPGRAFAERHGWSCDLVETRRELALPVDEDRLAALEDAAAAAGAGYELVTWRDRTPEPLLADRALLERRMTTDAPHGDLPVGEEEWDGDRIREHEGTHLARGRTVLSAGAVAGGRLVGFTDLQIPLAQPVLAHQGGTLVLREHRGHRLGARMKAAVLRELAAGFPEVRRVSTYNAEDNTPMVAVNEQLGFRPAGVLSSWSARL
ncbi:GNAT family N-acetyltransferase [Blastococcus sp. MG754426]|uniref:GNAT family N-acetyltransferase n=1 Tax=unclassified Blastococcus TaxID=2619396 RepID=UPI001EF110F3|nr:MULTISPECIES: GNAT family N-acetyltransferase [unclassified Blastococcus]MCF6508288.1 GNAT family N-acetyltransferase [Blastococcus sp. MG754426]MCF6512993.1 GNAT family N-acetyltransferase [Blastococcus sp. MG754427]